MAVKPQRTMALQGASDRTKTFAAPVPAIHETTDPATIVEWMRLVPSRLRRYAVTAASASRFRGITDELMRELQELGMPCRIRSGMAYFDDMDLDNVALHLGLPSTQRWAMQLWCRTLEKTRDQATAHYELQYTLRCPRHPEATPSDLRTVLPAASRSASGRDQHSLVLTRPTVWPQLPPACRDISDRLGDLRFFLVPPPLRDDLAFTRETRLAGCAVAARLTAAECRAHGITARTSFGLLLSVPYVTTHTWAETLVGDSWVCFDPHLLQTLVRHAGLNAARWPLTCSPGAILLRLAATRTTLAWHDEHPASVTMMSKLKNSARAHPYRDGAPRAHRGDTD
jgi:hypothetical protein